LHVVSIVFIFALFHTLHIISICCCRSTTISSLKFVSTSPTNISNMKLRNLSPIASMMLLTMVPYLFNAASMVTVMASDDHRAPFIKGGQQQLQQSDEMWEAQFYAENRALVSSLNKEQLQNKREESRKLQDVTYKRLRGHKSKSGKTEAPSQSPVPSGAPNPSPSGVPSMVPSDNPSGIPSIQPSDKPSRVPSFQPSDVPSRVPSDSPSGVPSESLAPSMAPSFQPSDVPTFQPSDKPSRVPSFQPSDVPSRVPSDSPSGVPSESLAPSMAKSAKSKRN